MRNTTLLFGLMMAMGAMSGNSASGRRMDISIPRLDPKMPIIKESGGNIKNDVISVEIKGEILQFETELIFTTQKAYNKKVTLLKHRIIAYLTNN